MRGPIATRTSNWGCVVGAWRIRSRDCDSLSHTLPRRLALFTSLHQHAGHAADLRLVLWYLYLVAAVMLPVHHVGPILKYLRGRDGIGDACIRTEAIQCGWRVPALLFSIFVAPSLPLFLSIFLDLVGRIGRVLAMHFSQRRWTAGQVQPSASSRRASSPEDTRLDSMARAITLARAR